MVDPTPTVLFYCIMSFPTSMFFGCEQGRQWVRRHQETRANSRWTTRKIDRRQIQRIIWLLLPQRGELDLKIGESLLISLAVVVTNSYRRSQFCHVDTAWSTILSTGWLHLWLQATIWAVAIRSFPRCCDCNPQKGQTWIQSLQEAFLTTVHPQLIGVHSTGEKKDGKNSNVH